MLVCQLGSHTSTRGTLNKALHDEEWLIHLLHRAAILADSRGNGANAHRTATELVDDGGENLVVYLVKTILVDVQRLQSHLSDVVSDGAITLHLGKIAHSSQQGVGDTRRTTRAARDFHSSLILDRHLQEHGTTLDNLLQCLWVIILQVQIDAETGTQWGGKQAAASGGSHQRKRIEIYLDAASGWSLVYHDVDAIILHRRIEILLHNGRKTVNLVDEEHIVGFERGKDTRQVAWLIEHRT